MILHDYVCQDCGNVFEQIVSWQEYEVPCSKCGKPAKRAFLPKSIPAENYESPSWLRSVGEIIDKDDHSPETLEFLAFPTRINYMKWLKAKNLRPIEPGEKRQTQSSMYDRKKMVDYLMRKHQQRNSIEVHSA